MYKLDGFTDEVLKKAMNSSIYSQKQYEKFHNTHNKFNMTSTSTRFYDNPQSNTSGSFYENNSVGQNERDHNEIQIQTRKSTNQQVPLDISHRNSTKKSIVSIASNKNKSKHESFKNEEGRDFQEGEIVLDTNNYNNEMN